MKLDAMSVALVGADDMHARELTGLLAEMGLETGRVLTFSEKLGQMELAVDEEGAEVLLPLEHAAIKTANVWVLFGSDARTKSQMEVWAEEDQVTVFDLSPGPAAAVHCTDPFLAPGLLRKQRSPMAMPDPAALYLAQVLASAPSGSLRRVDCHVLLPASAKGEPGIRELFQQSACLLNFKTVPTEVWGRQLAFNLLPSYDALGSEIFGSQVRALSGQKVDVSCLTLQTSVFHGTALSALIQAEDAHQLVAGMRRSIASEGRLRLSEDENWPSVLETGAADAPLVNLRAVAEEVLWIWLLYDNMKSGKAAIAARAIRGLLD